MAKEIATLDCETDPFEEGVIPEPFLWGFYTPKTGYLKFEKLSDLMEFLADKSYRIYAHNGGKFDFHYMLDYIKSWQKITMINNRLAEWRYNDNIFCDSYCILPVPLSAYNKTEINYDIFKKDSRYIPENWEKIVAYLNDDLVYLYELVSEFIENYGTHLTIASCAIKKLQKMCGIKVENSGRHFFEEMSQYYYGGRVQCFKKGLIQGDIHCYDINSAYPRAMLDEHPVGQYITTEYENPEIIGGNFYEVEAPSVGVLPYRNDDKTLFFPDDGEPRRFLCTGWELLALKKIKKVKIKHISQKIFLEKKNFSEYVNYFYNIKLLTKKGSPENIFSKLFLNAAYGKFGANPQTYKETRIVEMCDTASALERGYDIHGEINGRLIVSKQNPEETWRYYNVATAASITGWVRAQLALSLSGLEEPLYCDTDSLTFIGTHNLKVGAELGEWKHEGDFTIAGIGGKKIYAMKNEITGEEKTACKGARLDFDEIMRVCKGEIIEKNSIVPIYSIKKGKFFLKKTIAMT